MNNMDKRIKFFHERNVADLMSLVKRFDKKSRHLFDSILARLLKIGDL
jgi:hypothetical protein